MSADTIVVSDYAFLANLEGVGCLCISEPLELPENVVGRFESGELIIDHAGGSIRFAGALEPLLMASGQPEILLAELGESGQPLFAIRVKIA